jgi:rare lipoprotein A
MKARLFFFMMALGLSVNFSSHAQIGIEAYGRASFYANFFYGRTTSNGEKLNREEYTAAHRTLPFNTMLEVTNLQNGKVVIVRVNDRGPFKKARMVDLSYKAAKELGFLKKGLCNVRVRIVGIDGVVQLATDDKAPTSGLLSFGSTQPTSK